MKKVISIVAPGSKSITNRVLILAALAKGKTVIKNAADCDDTKYLLLALKKLGIKITQKGDQITVHGNGGKFKKQNGLIALYTQNAGTTTRFLTALCTLSGLKVKIDGNKRMRERPIKELINALNLLGAKIESRTGCPPLIVHPKKLRGGICNLPGNISSQYLSAILMTAPFASEKTTISIEQEFYSKPYVEMTIEILKEFGTEVVNKNFKQFTVRGKQSIKSPKTYTVESDASSASYVGAYAALHPEKEIHLKNLPTNSLQGDIAFLSYLKKMGCLVMVHKTSISVQGPSSLKSLGKIDMNATPDLVMTFAVLALFTPGKTRITNIANLRIKETDRISALKNELSKLGAKVNAGKDFIEIESRLKNVLGDKPVVIETYNDHRMAMAFGILKDIIPNLKIENPKCVSKSYTTFWKDLKTLNR